MEETNSKKIDSIHSTSTGAHIVNLAAIPLMQLNKKSKKACQRLTILLSESTLECHKSKGDIKKISKQLLEELRNEKK